MSLLPPGASDEERGRTLAWVLIAGFGAKGNFMEADPEVVASLIALMADWPVHEDSWWSNLWPGLVEGPGRRESYALLQAMYEALHQTLPEEEWLYRLETLSELNAREDGVAGAVTWSMGAYLGRQLDSERFASLLTQPGSDRWRRVLIKGFPDELRWPAAGHGQIPLEAMLAFLEMRDAPEFPYRLDIVQYQWELLGPREASTDLENFVFSIDPSTPGWDWEAALRVSAAVEALQVTSPGQEDVVFLDHTRELVKELFVSTSAADSRNILIALRDRWWKGATDYSNHKQMIIDLLGPERLLGLDDDLRSWLEAR